MWGPSPPHACGLETQKCKRFELDLGMSNETLLSVLEYGAEPKEMEFPDDDGIYAAYNAEGLSSELSKQMAAIQNAHPEHSSASGHGFAAAIKERRVSSAASPTLSDRQRLIPAWKPTDEARAASRSGGASGSSPTPRGPAQKPRAAWGAGPAAQAPPPGRRPAKQPIRRPASSAAAPQQALIERAAGGSLALMAVLPKTFPCSLGTSPTSSTEAPARAATEDLGKAVGVARPRTSSGSEGGAGQLVRSRAGSGRWGLAPAPAGALHAGAAQAQLRAKNRMIADLRTQKQQLTEELEAALMENGALRQRVAAGERLKSQHDGLLERLRSARKELDQALADKKSAEAAAEPLQQRIRALAAKQAVQRDTEHRMAARMLEKNQMLDQLYNTLKELKQQYEAAREEAAEATAGLQQAQRQVAEHHTAIEEAHGHQKEATAALVSLGLRCEGLGDALAAETSARKAAETALEGTHQDLQDKSGQLSSAAKDLHGARQRVGNLERELADAHEMAGGQRRRAEALQEDLHGAWIEAHEARHAVASLAEQVAALRGRLTEAPTNDDEEDDAEEDDDLEGSDLDVALPAFMGESRAQLMRSQDMARGQLLAAAAGGVGEGVGAPQDGHDESDEEEEEEANALTMGSQSPSIFQDGVVQSAKEAFEAMSASGGWSVYNNKVARRISNGRHSSGLAHELSM